MNTLTSSRHYLGLSTHPLNHTHSLSTGKHYKQPRILKHLPPLASTSSSKTNNATNTNNDDEDYDSSSNDPPPLLPSPLSPPTTLWEILKIQSQFWAVILPLGYAGVPLTAAFFNTVLHIPNGSALAAVSVESIILVAVLALVRYHNVTPKFIDINENIQKQIGFGVLAGIAALLLNQLLFAGSSTTTNGSIQAVSEILSQGSTLTTVALFIASVVLAPATEELVYRAFLLDALRSSGSSNAVAVGGSAFLFAIGHVDAGLQGTVQLFVVGCCLGGAFVSAGEGSLLASFVGHSLYNAVLFAGALAQ